MLAPGPHALLRRLCAEKATGELIAAGDSVEVHLYLQAGRVAWGTTTEARFVFRRHLVEHCGVDGQVLQDALAGCQRTRRPLGEALVSSGVVSSAQVREGLRAQVKASIDSLARCSPSQMLFLRRGEHFLSYDQSLTFDLDGLEAAGAIDAGELLRMLQRAEPSLSWATVVSDRGEVVAQVGGEPLQSTVELTRRLATDIELVAVRSSEGNVVGGSIRPGLSIWAGLAREHAIGTALSSIAALSPRRDADEQAWSSSSFDELGEPHAAAGDLRRMLEQAGCPAGLVVLDSSADPDVWVLCRQPLPPEVLGEAAFMRHTVLEQDVFETHARARDADIGFAHQTVLAGDRRWWWFGVELPRTSMRSAWLVLPRSAGIGLGWALLATAARVLTAGAQ